MTKRNKFPRPCMGCGTPTWSGSYCPTHTKPKTESPERKARKRELYNTEYKRQAKLVRDNATQCWICGGGPRPHDPWQADHLAPGVPGSPLQSAHRSCNARRGNTPLDMGGKSPRVG